MVAEKLYCRCGKRATVAIEEMGIEWGYCDEHAPLPAAGSGMDLPCRWLPELTEAEQHEVEAENIALEIAEFLNSKGNGVTKASVLANYRGLSTSWTADEFERFKDLQVRLFHLLKGGA
ncbi:MAG: hypothetical protein CL607_15100 [Anaerolineaceae bacterium]|nr:hypothetical protein [Anaerolineaceae bacterium]